MPCLWKMLRIFYKGLSWIRIMVAAPHSFGSILGKGKSLLHRPGRKLSRQGFSLVEVTLALGIVAFAVIAILGLSATSFQSLSDSRNAETSRNIYRTVSGALINSPFVSLPNAETIRAFDGSGFAAAADAETIFRARITPMPAAAIGGGDISQEAGRVFQVAIYHAPGSVALREDRKIFSAPVVVSRREKEAGNP